MEERRQYDRRKRTRRYDELTDRELLERYKHSVIPNDPYVLSIKLRTLFEYTVQVLVAVWIGLSINPESPYKVYMILGLMILINLKYDLPNRIVEWYDKKNNR